MPSNETAGRERPAIHERAAAAGVELSADTIDVVATLVQHLDAEAARLAELDLTPSAPVPPAGDR